MTSTTQSAATNHQSTDQTSDALGAARSLVALIEAEAEAAELAGTMTEPVVDALHDAGLFALMVPRELGGTEADMRTCLEVFELLAWADGSTGWSHMANATAAAMAATFTGEEAVSEIFADARSGGRMPVIAGMFGPVGSAEDVADGYVATGRYGFASGSGHATWISAGTLVVRDGEFVAAKDGLPEMRVVFVPRDHVEFLGNWDVIGLQGTGSYDYALADEHVDAAFTFPLVEAVAHRGGPVYGFGVLGITSAGHAGFALGVAKRALDEVVRIVAGKARLGAAPVRDQQLFQYELGYQDAALRSVRALVFEAFAAVEAELVAGREPGEVARQRLRQTTTYATRIAAEVVRFAYTWAGTSALREPSVLGRCFRDMHAATQHVFVDNNTFTDAGILRLNPPAPPS
ncbi:MAG: acyl-CoA dehydrogenase family protein [Acidimicrobiia bacterium]|nr:acyl-CoA dehydrogenase family protein [Acidimicrobiia bacterium]